jgi:hypothetical protein
MIQGNLLGLLMFVFAGVFVALGAFVLRLPDVVVMITTGAIVFLTDLLYRLRLRGQTGWLTGKQTGGYLYVLPAWIAGLAVIALNVINFLVKK